jgi:phage pi2 protein 07
MTGIQDCSTSLGSNNVEANLIESFCDKFDVKKDEVINTNYHFTYCDRPRKRQMIKKGGEVYYPPFGGWQKISLQCESKQHFFQQITMEKFSFKFETK